MNGGNKPSGDTATSAGPGANSVGRAASCAGIVREGIYADCTFTRLDGTAQDFLRAEFERCLFEECDFSYTDLSHAYFMDCTFVRCRFVVPGLQGTHLQKVLFDGCSLAGMDFGQCVKVGFGVEFRASKLDNCSFYELKLSGTRFGRCELKGCLLSESDLTKASFDECRLPETEFDRCRLTGADFRTALDFTIDPGRNTLRGAKFSSFNLAGLLSVYGIVIE